MVEGRVDEDATVVPCSGLDANGLVNQSTLDERFGSDENSCVAGISSD